MSFRRYCDLCGLELIPDHASGDLTYCEFIALTMYDTNSAPSTSDAHLACAKQLVPKLHRALMDESIARVEMKRERIYR